MTTRKGTFTRSAFLKFYIIYRSSSFISLLCHYDTSACMHTLHFHFKVSTSQAMEIITATEGIVSQGNGIVNSTLNDVGTSNSTLFADRTISTLFGDGTTNSTLFGDRTTIATLFGDATKISTVFGDATKNSTLFDNGLVNTTLFGVGDFAVQNLSQPSAPKTTEHNLWLSYTMATFASIFLLIGLFGNGMTLVVTLKSEKRFKPHNILIMSLAVADTLSLVVHTSNVEAFGELLLFDITALKSANDFTCKLYNAVTRVSNINSTLMIMLICIERFIVVWFPLKARQILTRCRTTLAVAACVTATVVIAGIPWVMYSSTINGTCYLGLDVDGDGENDTLQSVPFWMLITTLFVLVTPTLIILSLTPLTIAKLYRQHAVRRGLTNQETSTGPHRTSVLLTAVVVLYLLLAGIPQLVYSVLSISGTNVTTTTDSWGSIARLTFLIVLQANYSTNFILYTMLNREFRQNLFSMLGCCSFC